MGIVLVEVCVCFNRLLSVYVCPNKLLRHLNKYHDDNNVALALIIFLNILGSKEGKAFQTPILALTTALILIICIIQLFDGNTDFSRPIDGAFDVSKQEPTLIAETAALVFVAYAGIYKAGAIGGEIKKSREKFA